MRLLLFIILLFPALAHADEVDCGNLETEIRKDIDKLDNCWTDADCGYQSFGCPWELGFCTSSPINRNEQDKIKLVKEKIRSFKGCVEKDREMNEKCRMQNEFDAKGLCRGGPQLLCLNGRCVNQTKVIMREENNNGVDIYGSKAILGEQR